jgi:hypothetical protein
MTYRRVLPRDLFNEGDLLKCLGKVWLLTERARAAGFVEEAVDFFDIVQDPLDGSIYVANLTFRVLGADCRLFRPLNARSHWPLYIQAADFEIAVFEEDGTFTPEMKALIG